MYTFFNVEGLEHGNHVSEHAHMFVDRMGMQGLTWEIKLLSVADGMERQQRLANDGWWTEVYFFEGHIKKSRNRDAPEFQYFVAENNGRTLSIVKHPIRISAYPHLFTTVKDALDCFNSNSKSDVLFTKAIKQAFAENEDVL